MPRGGESDLEHHVLEKANSRESQITLEQEIAELEAKRQPHREAIEAILEDEFCLPGSDGVAALRFQIPSITNRIIDRVLLEQDCSSE